ncbi:putative secreted protein [Aminobacter lissarensis]|uniref:Secreted protein n=1 Tax=Aminobacter carboxidus TaxID=376165 RepID=A0A8E1WC79_9HYPH|nr:DUF6074 family protein [Aminobacter lissarensis]MBB6465588.1 putative secreted protein [Aminobacter lissarensis]
MMRCNVIPFPTARRTRAIHFTAKLVATRNSCEADTYWRNVIAGMRLQMVKSWLADEVIDCELRQFARSVFQRIGS